MLPERCVGFFIQTRNEKARRAQTISRNRSENQLQGRRLIPQFKSQGL